MFRKKDGKEALRVQQQGSGRPIVSAALDDVRLVAVGDTLFHSKSWKVFPDFLQTYIKMKLGVDWGNQELKKPLSERHTILHWYDELCRQQLDWVSFPGVIHGMPITGAVICYVGLAYNLYLLDHNVELQERYLARLRNPENFQGAYYELVVAGILIQSGFRLELEDETDETSKHCEFSAISMSSGKKYWVETKMRSVVGQFGKRNVDGVSSTRTDPTTRLSQHVSEALNKPAPDERLIFVDLNTEVKIKNGVPRWLNQAVRRLDAREHNLRDGQAAYLFVTNLAFHRSLDSKSQGREVLAYGLGIPDFSKPGEKTLIEMYREKQKHADANGIMDSLKQYPVFPDTFDGSLFSDRADGNVKIGETYQFPDVGDPPCIIGTVNDAFVLEKEAVAHIIVRTKDGKNIIGKFPLSQEQMVDYRKHKDTFFGVKREPSKQTEDPLDLFEWMHQTYKNSSKEQLLKFMKDAVDIESLKKESQQDLALIYCERLTVQICKDNGRAKS